MQIQTNHIRLPVSAAITPDGTKSSHSVVGESAQFQASKGLDAAIRSLPDVRQEEVERATRLVDTGNYPPPELIDRLSRLLADVIVQPPGE